MKKLRICFVLLALASLCLALPQEVSGADLQAGWFAEISSVNIYVYDQWGQVVLYGGAFFGTPTGTYGPFLVTDEPYGGQYYRTVRVPTNAYDVAPGTGVELPIYGISSTPQIAKIGVGWGTDYNASAMRLEFVQRDPITGHLSTLWSQTESGYQYHTTSIAYDVSNQGLFFRVVAVPEPASIAGFLATLSLAVSFIVRRPRR
ncbi:MAG: PEP-CTERM sorting domain-containing protein [Armatimonadota bacterium]|nr:PEP-CTERM sorting domain-containing protein [Armatimonadota bacterium]